MNNRNVSMCRRKKKIVVNKKNIIQNRKSRNVENDIRIFSPSKSLMLLEHLKLLSEDMLTSL